MAHRRWKQLFGEQENFSKKYPDKNYPKDKIAENRKLIDIILSEPNQ